MNRLIRAWVLSLVCVSAVHAQQDTVVLRGTVLDRGSHQPLSGAYLMLLHEAGVRTIADTLGRFVLPTNLRGRQPLSVACPQRYDLWTATLDTIMVDVRPELGTALVILVNGVACALPPFEARHLDVWGYYSSGFEDNRFFPDPDSSGVPIVWGGNPAGRHAFVNWSPAGKAQRPPWPHVDSLQYSACFRVHWVGTLTGPGARIPSPMVAQPFKPVVSTDSMTATFVFAGQGSIAAYSFLVDSTIAVSVASRTMCQ